MIGLLADKTVNGVGASFHQLLVQVGGVVLTAINAVLLTYVFLKNLGAVKQINPTQKKIEEGLDKTLLEETAYDKN